MSVISIFYFYLSSQNRIVGLIADDAVYLLMTDYFSPYYRSLSQSAAFIMETSQFPPLYPLLLSVLGASSENIFLAHIFTTSCFFGAVIIYACWVYKDNENKLAASCLSLLFVCLPASVLMIMDLWSEHLYILLTMLALLLLEKARGDKRYWLIASIVIGLIPLVRMAGITFVFAYLVYLYIHKIKYRYKYIAISIIPFLLWKVISIDYKLPEIYENTLINYYQNDLWLVFKNLFLVQLPNLWAGWHECFDIQKSLWSGVVCACILLMALATWITRLIKNKIDSFYLLFYLLLILLWPAPDHDMRFVFVVIPILFFYSYLSLSSLLKNNVLIRLKVITNCASMFIVLVTFLPTDLYAINRLFMEVPMELKSYRNTRYWLTATPDFKPENSVKVMDKMILSFVKASQFIPEEECAYSVHQEQFMFYARRLAYPLPLPKDIKNDNILLQLDKCDYIHVHNTSSHPYFPGGYPIDLLGENFNYLMLTRMSDDINSPVVGELLQLH